jgi:hypothetical protein
MIDESGLVRRRSAGDRDPDARAGEDRPEKDEADRPPERLGFPGIESFPSTVPGQVLHPLPAERAVRHLLRAGIPKEEPR